MKRSLLLAGVALLFSNPFAAAQAPRLDTLYATVPSKELLKDLQDQLATAPSRTGLERLRRVELAARIIQIDLVLGEQGSKKYADSVIRPSRGLEALDALQALDPAALNDLKSADTRRVLWDAIAFAHPAYHMYVDAVRLAGHDEDPEVLERTLKQLLSAWSKGGNTRPLSELRQPLGLWGRDVLCDCLRMQAVRDPEGAIKLSTGLKTIAESMTRRPRTTGNPPVMGTRSFPQLRASGKVTDFERAMHQAAALQRAGHEVSFWSVAAERELDAETKTIAQEPIVIYPEEPGKTTMIAVGAGEVLGKLKGEEVLPHVYRFASPTALDNLLISRVQYRVIMSEVLDAQSSPTAWANAMQKFLTTRTGAAGPRELLIDLNFLDPWAGFTAAATESLAVAAQPAFLKSLDDHNIRLTVSKVSDDKAETPVAIRDPRDRDRESILLRHEAVLGRAFQTLPAKFLAFVQTINLQSEPLREKVPIGTVEGNRVITREVEAPVDGRGWSNRLMLASPKFEVAVRELSRSWVLARHEKFTVGDWEGTAANAFNEISWQRMDDKWTIRGTVRADDFVRNFDGSNERDDLAAEAEHYVVQSKALRGFVRTQLKRGNLAPAAKYLFIKQVAFLDGDGKCIEYETDVNDPPFTRDEFEHAVNVMETRKPLTDEQKRLRALVARFIALAQEMVKSGRIV